MDLLSRSVPVQTIEEAHAPAIARGANCTQCPLYGLRRGPVMPEIVRNARLTVIGEAPGNQEVELKRPFIGKSGDELNEALERGGLDRAECTITNTILCQPEGGDFTAYMETLNRVYESRVLSARERGEPIPPPPLTPQVCCAPRLHADIADSNSKTILAVGARALQAMAEHFNVPYGHGDDQTGKVTIASIKQQHGAPIPMADGRILCSSLHPAYAMRDMAYVRIVRLNITRAAEIAVRGGINWSEPSYITFPTLAQIQQVTAAFRQNNTQVTLDIETDSADMMSCRVRCVGLGGVLPGDSAPTIIVVPFRWMDGREYWPTADLVNQAAEAVRLVLDECPLVCHNGQFDTGVCQRVGLMSKPAIFKPSTFKKFDDTMLAHHDTDSNDLPHDLGFVAREYLEAPLWKKDVDHKAAVGVAVDTDLHLYNARDVYVTHQLWQQLDQRMAECGTTQQYATDRELAPVAREMTNLGVPVDEHRRGYFSRRFNELTLSLAADFKRISKKDINPRSPVQLGTWLFEERKLAPPLNTSGFEWQHGQDWSTSTPALMQLCAKGVPEDVKDAINSLLAYRACETIRGRYLDGLQVTPLHNHPLLVNVDPAPEIVFNGKTVLLERPAFSLIHPSWKLHVVPTGRWSSSPNCQNVPSRSWSVEKDANGVDVPTNLRTMFAALPGHVFVAADMDQVELRIYAAVAGDKLLLKAFRDNLDPHTLNLASLLAPTPAAVMATYAELNAKKKGTEKEQADLKYLRTIAKRFAFLEIYGGKENKLFQTMVSERDKATNQLQFEKLKPAQVREWHRRWHAAHPETAEFHAEVARELRQYGRVAVPGLDYRCRYFRDGTTQENAPPNMKIQGFAASKQNDSVLKVTEAIPFYSWSPYTGLILQVHDQLIMQVPESRGEETCVILKKCMRGEIAVRGGGVLELTASPKISRNWAKAD